MMEFSYKKIIGILFFVGVITLGVILYLNRSQPLAILSFTVGSAQLEGEMKVRSETSALFTWVVQGAKTCALEGSPLFSSPETALTLPEGTLQKMTDDFSAGNYVLRCWDRRDAVVERSVTLSIIPTKKLVLCQNGCGQGGRVVEDSMTRFLGETAQNIRACFGSAELACPLEDVTKKAAWTSSDTQIATWTNDYVIDGKVVASHVYQPMTLKTERVGTVEATVTYNGYQDKLSVTGKIVGSQ